MKIFLDRIDNEFLFEARNERGNTVLMDNKNRQDGIVKGAGPMELLLMGIAGCSGIDIVSILKKQKQTITKYHVELEAEREQDKVPALFQNAHLKVFLEGAIDPSKALRAAQLSFDVYCSVSKTLEKTMKITYEVHLNGTKL
ncbi:OsmC family protein [Ascidiimonas sp. W6]|uniref:OsmC family protein n=1 Tax=Ascidiimonas meishanensis TaxID=3128903 RepID=UPI0030EDDE68